MPIHLILLLLISTTDTTADDLPRGGGWRQEIAILPASESISIGDDWAILSSLRIVHADDTLELDQDYRLHPALKSIEILPVSGLSPGDSVQLEYQSARITDHLVHSRYAPVRKNGVDTTDVKPVYTKTVTRPLDPFKSWSGLKRSGSITRGVRFGGSAGGDLTSGLHLELSGSPRKDVTLEAVLDDRSLPVSGSGGSTTLRELDRLLLRVTTPHLEARMGDFDLKSSAGRYATFQRRVKGGGIALKFDALRTDFAATGGDENYRSISFPGRDGDQGPYELTDRFDRPGVRVVAGSDVIHLDGKRLTRGRRGDYLVDYDRGTVVFNPNVILRHDSRIDAEYEYTDQHFARSLYYGFIKTPGASRSGFRIEAAAMSEGRNGDSPLTFDWTDAWRNKAAAAGDDPSAPRVSGVEQVEDGDGDYIWGIADDDSILVFSTPDSLGRPTGNLLVEFSIDSSGSYVREYDAVIQTFLYRWVGDGMGEWTPEIILPLPDRSDLVDIAVSYQTEHVEIVGETAFSSFDQNTLSGLDDGDNEGYAFTGSSVWKPQVSRPFSMALDIRHESDNFHPVSRKSEIDHNYRWDLPETEYQPETSFESTIGFKPIEVLSMTASGGYLERQKSFTGRRFHLRGALETRQVQAVSSITHTDGDQSRAKGSRWRTLTTNRLSGQLGRNQPSYVLRTEVTRVMDSLDVATGDRYYEHEAGWLHRISTGNEIAMNFIYRLDDEFRFDAYQRNFDARTITAEWKGRRPLWGGWRVDLQRFYQTFTDINAATVRSTSMSLDARINPTERIWNVWLDYYLRTGNDRATAQVASYVGEGNGGYRREGDRYVADPDGDFDLHEALTDTIRPATRIDFNGQFELRPRRKANQGSATPSYPFGISRTTTRFNAELSTFALNPWRAYLLMPEAFRNNESQFARWDWLQDVYFLENNSGGDGRLTLSRNEMRSSTAARGETTVDQSIIFRLRLKMAKTAGIHFSPSWRRTFRSDNQSRNIISDVYRRGGSVEINLKDRDKSLEYQLGTERDWKHNRTTAVSLVETRVYPTITWIIRRGGTVRINGEWRHLESTNPSPGYDLTGFWEPGSNWSLGGSIDYRLGSSITATASYNGRWRGSKRPSHSGIMELTAQF